MKYEIKNRWTGVVIYVEEAESCRALVEKLIREDKSLRGANMRGADMRGADMRGADIDTIKGDFFLVLVAQPAEISGLRSALVEGRINGSAYEGECACLVGTIANVAKCNYESLVVKPNQSRPIERFFLGIKKGDTPETNQFSKFVLDWLDEFVSQVKLIA